MLQGAEAEDLADELSEVSAEGYVVAVYEGLWFLAEVSRDQARSRPIHPAVVHATREPMPSCSPQSQTSTSPWPSTPSSRTSVQSQ
jgi:hypothetical protein